MCNSKHLCKIPQGISLYKINFNVFNVCLCCQQFPVTSSLYICFLLGAFSSAKTIAPNFQLHGFGKINRLISKILHGDTNKLS